MAPCASARGGQRVVALWAEQRGVWRLLARERQARILARDGRDLTPPALAHGAILALDPDDGPVYLIGRIAVRPMQVEGGDP